MAYVNCWAACEVPTLSICCSMETGMERACACACARTEVGVMGKALTGGLERVVSVLIKDCRRDCGGEAMTGWVGV